MASKRGSEHYEGHAFDHPPWIVRQKRMRVMRQLPGRWARVRMYVRMWALCWYWIESACTEKYRRAPCPAGDGEVLEGVVSSIESMEIDAWPLGT